MSYVTVCVRVDVFDEVSFPKHIQHRVCLRTYCVLWHKFIFVSRIGVFSCFCLLYYISVTKDSVLLSTLFSQV